MFDLRERYEREHTYAAQRGGRHFKQRQNM